MILFIILGILLGALAVIFALQNVAIVTVTFLTYQLTGSLSIVLFTALIVGFVICLLVGVPTSIRSMMHARKLTQQNKALQDQITVLKSDLELSRKQMAIQQTTIPTDSTTRM